ncbi:MAG: hypothetical protein JHD35_01140 [Sphingopyxis sp.]|nr:hypothetical protein [Sphingopyxis sp.]
MRGTALQSGAGATIAVCTLSGRINADLSLPKLAGTVYAISGRVDVGTDVGADGAASDGRSATLTIAPGVIFYGASTADWLVVNRGSRVEAVGSASEPIIFTAVGNVRGERTAEIDSHWRGITILGRAPINNCIASTAIGGTAGCEASVRDADVRFGGAIEGDNSGTIRFVQIRYTNPYYPPVGPRVGAGLRLAGVGYATTVDHVQIHDGANDGLLLYGGRVSIKYLAVTGNRGGGIAAFDGYRGSIQYLVHRQADFNSSFAINVLNKSGGTDFDALPRTYLRISNATMVHASNSVNNAILVSDGVDFALLNSVLDTNENILGIWGLPTVRAPDDALEDLGPPVFRSALLDSNGITFDRQSDVGFAQQAAIFGSGTNNNNATFTTTLLASLANGPNETAVPSFDPTPFNADPYASTPASTPNRMTAVAYVGAIRDASDTAFIGWTCRTSYADFGSNSRECGVAPLL